MVHKYHCLWVGVVVICCRYANGGESGARNADNFIFVQQVKITSPIKRIRYYLYAIMRQSALKKLNG